MQSTVSLVTGQKLKQPWMPRRISTITMACTCQVMMSLTPALFSLTCLFKTMETTLLSMWWLANSRSSGTLFLSLLWAKWQMEPQFNNQSQGYLLHPFSPQEPFWMGQGGPCLWNKRTEISADYAESHWCPWYFGEEALYPPGEQGSFSREVFPVASIFLLIQSPSLTSLVSV